MSTSLRIGFDARLSGARHAGIGRYTTELLRELLPVQQLEGSDVFLHWIVWVNHLDQAVEFPKHVEVRQTSVRHYGLAEQVWGIELTRAQLDLLHVPHFNVPLTYRRPFVVTIHDLLWHTQQNAQATTLPSWQYAVKSIAYRMVSESAIRRAERVLVPSQVVAEEVATHTGRREGVQITSEGLGEAFVSVELSAKKDQSSNTIFYVGSLYPHKNLQVVLEALRLLPDWQLRIASSRSVFGERFRALAQELGVSEQVQWLGSIDDQSLIQEMQSATLVIQPSKSEGFGLTVLEGLAVGATVLTSNIPIFQEIGGEHIATFSLLDAKSCAAACQQIALNPPSLAQRKAAQAWARNYTWKKTAAQTLAAYREVLGV